MSALTKAQLTAKIDLLITTNANNEITGSNTNEILKDVVDSLINILDDGDDLGFVEYSTTKPYLINEITYFDNNIYISREAQTDGAFTVARWEKLTNRNNHSDYNLTFPLYVNATIYNIGDKVRYIGGFFICDSNGTTGVIPDDTASEWSSVFTVSNNDARPTWEIGWYLENQVVKFVNKEYYLTADTATGAYESTTNPVIDSTNWSQYNKSGAMTGTENSFVTFDNTGSPVETDEIKKLGASIEIKTLLNLLGGLIQLSDVGGDIQLIDASTGDIILKSDAYKFIVQANGGSRFEGAVDIVDSLLSIINGAFTGSVEASLLTANRAYLLPNKSITFAGLEDIEKTVFETAVASYAVTGTLTTVPLCTYTIPADEAGDYVMEFSGSLSLSDDSDMNCGMYQSSGGPFTLKNESFREGNITRLGSGSVTSKINIHSLTLKFGASVGDVIDFRAIETDAAVIIDGGIFKIKKI